MKRSSESADRHALRPTESPRSESNDPHFLYRSRSSDRPDSGPTQSESESRPHDTQSLHSQSLDGRTRTPPISERNPQEFTRSLYRSRSSDRSGSGPTQSESESRPHDTQPLHRQSLDGRTPPISERNPQEFIRSPSRSQSSGGLASRFVQSERGPVYPNTTVERSQTNPPLSHRRSFDGTFPHEASRQSPDSRSSLNIARDPYITKSPESTPVPENKPPEVYASSELPTPPSIVAESSGIRPVLSTKPSGIRPVLSTNRNRLSSELSSRPPHSTEIWTPSSAQIGDTIQSAGNSASSFRGYPYERSQPIDRGTDLRRPDEEIALVVPSTSYRPETLSRDSMGERGSNQTNDRDVEKMLGALGITNHSTPEMKEVGKYAKIIMDVAKNGGGEKELLERLSEESTRIARERDQANNRDVETLLRALGIRDDDLGSGNYLEAREQAQTIVRVIRTGGQDKEFNDASKALLELAPKRFWLRSLVNPRKDTIDWYDASWRNQQAINKLDTTKWGGYIRKKVYQANQPLAGIANTRSGNLSFIALQALAGTAYTSYIEKGFASSTLLSSLEYAASARLFYTLFPNPINQAADTIQFQGVSIGLYKALENLTSPARNATMGG